MELDWLNKTYVFSIFNGEDLRATVRGHTSNFVILEVEDGSRIFLNIQSIVSFRDSAVADNISPGELEALMR